MPGWRRRCRNSWNRSVAWSGRRHRTGRCRSGFPCPGECRRAVSGAAPIASRLALGLDRGTEDVIRAMIRLPPCRRGRQCRR
ncbi:protein of unknown function [Rhodovastum atsumiense]|nr:protein of unknown function [Rhodovastum atsumiense]